MYVFFDGFIGCDLFHRWLLQPAIGWFFDGFCNLLLVDIGFLRSLHLVIYPLVTLRIYKMVLFLYSDICLFSRICDGRRRKEGMSPQLCLIFKLLPPACLWNARPLKTLTLQLVLSAVFRCVEGPDSYIPREVWNFSTTSRRYWQPDEEVFGLADAWARADSANWRYVEYSPPRCLFPLL